MVDIADGIGGFAQMLQSQHTVKINPFVLRLSGGIYAEPVGFFRQRFHDRNKTVDYRIKEIPGLFHVFVCLAGVNQKFGLIAASGRRGNRFAANEIIQTVFNIIGRNAAKLRQFFHASGAFVAVIQNILRKRVVDINIGKGAGGSVVVPLAVDPDVQLYRS